ncbi:TolB family protein [Daejeonella sp.]|uniref:TolB family protein n=1 Tax=Daejeonella sp. TaxID=2805397 RepID=UPI003C749737
MIFKTLFIRITTLFILSINTQYATGQIFDSQQNPPELKWMQINTPQFQILYPTPLKKEAERMANTVEVLIKSVSQSLGKEPRKITIILQNQGVISNGFVQLAPRRSEFFTTPPQNFDIQDWLNSLAVHELRHVVQIDKLTGNLKAPLFEELALAIFGITLPPWFFEGDAVGIETALTHGGRGRLPDWEIIFRTNTLSKNLFSYSKDYFGSLKDPTPGYYQLGYFMTSKLRRDYGSGIIDSLMTNMARIPFRPYNLSREMKKITGLSTRMLHDSTIAEIANLWKDQENMLKPQDYIILNQRNNSIPVDYLFPVKIAPDVLLSLREGFDKTPVIIMTNNLGKENELIKIGYQTESNFNYSSQKIVWDEFRYDKRFQKRSYNVINIYDLTDGKYRQLTHKTRLFAPSLSPDGNYIAAINVDLSNRSELLELDAETGNPIRTYANPENYFLQTPSFSLDGNRIVCVAINKNGAALIEFNRFDGTQNLLTDFQWQQLSRPVYTQDRILFRAHYNGVNNIYSFQKGFGIQQLTSTRYGASNPSFDKNTKSLVFNIYQERGYDITSISLDTNKETSISNIRNTFINYASPLVAQESDSTILDHIPTKEYVSSPYKELSNLFYFHSLSPIAEANEFNTDLNVGFKLKSNNQLNTLDFYTGYQFNSGLRKSEYLAGFSYKRFFPVLDVKYINRARLSYATQTQGGVRTLIPVNWRENFLEMEIRIPFLANRLNKTYVLGLSGNTSYTNRYEISNRPSGFADRIQFPLQYQFYFNHNSQRSRRDIAPRWGQNISVAYQSLPFDKKISGNIFRVQTSFFTPGLFANHSLQSSFNYQNAGGVYQFNVDIPRVSGYGNLPSGKIRNTLLFDYRLPLFYPDAEIWSLAYIKRIRGAIFADFQNIGKGNPFAPRTYGLELNGDLNLLRFLLPDFVISGKLIFINDRKPKPPTVDFGFAYNL